MLCPVDQAALQMTERQGVEIDYCPKCRGVWLDRGELDKILERAAREEGPAAAPPAAAPPPPPPGYDPRYERRYEDPRYYGKKRRKSFLEEIFD